MDFFSNFIYGNYGPGPKWNFAQITIMVLVLVLSGKWGSAQIFFHGNYGSGPKWSSYQIFKYGPGRAQV